MAEAQPCNSGQLSATGPKSASGIDRVCERTVVTRRSCMYRQPKPTCAVRPSPPEEVQAVVPLTVLLLACLLQLGGCFCRLGTHILQQAGVQQTGCMAAESTTKMHTCLSAGAGSGCTSRPQQLGGLKQWPPPPDATSLPPTHLLRGCHVGGAALQSLNPLLQVRQ